MLGRIYCGGNGRGRRVVSCGGYGAMSKEVEPRKCEFCNGTGLSVLNEVCPSCGGSDNKPYTDANGIKMRACGRCMIQWRGEKPLARGGLGKEVVRQVTRKC